MLTNGTIYCMPESLCISSNIFINSSLELHLFIGKVQTLLQGHFPQKVCVHFVLSVYDC